MGGGGGGVRVGGEVEMPVVAESYAVPVFVEEDGAQVGRDDFA